MVSFFFFFIYIRFRICISFENASGPEILELYFSIDSTFLLISPVKLTDIEFLKNIFVTL